MTSTEQIQARLRLAAEGRLTYAATLPDCHDLHTEAHAFELAANLITDPEALKGLIPSEMWDRIV
ncbi:hypothetical protein [Saccharopolyspora griseoalba]|uniref:Uncharacterized protein n=1 Tax=Saccharopolyspora griseoalba TaxID=1431848 RepID=A0ABW2LSF7_9PSEU